GIVQRELVLIDCVDEESSVRVSVSDHTGNRHSITIDQIVSTAVDDNWLGVRCVADNAAVDPLEPAERRVQSLARAAQAADELHDLGAPAGDVAGYLLEVRHGPLAASKADRVEDIKTLAARVEARDQVGGEQIAQVRDDPVVATFDRLILPHTIQAAA